MKKVLIVEDDSCISKLLNNLLSPKYNVEIASNCNETYESINNFKPDIVLLDIRLPDANGLDICRNIKNKSMINVPKIIIITSDNSKETMEKAKQAGADWYIAKPFKIKNIFERIESL